VIACESSAFGIAAKRTAARDDRNGYVYRNGFHHIPAIDGIAVAPEKLEPIDVKTGSRLTAGALRVHPRLISPLFSLT
jgi:hypothetical protein